MSDYGFKFEIGSFVKLTLSERQTARDSWLEQETRGQILSRLLEECPGGIQRHYSIRWVRNTGNFSAEITRHNEIELVASEPFPEREKRGNDR